MKLLTLLFALFFLCIESFAFEESDDLVITDTEQPLLSETELSFISETDGLSYSVDKTITAGSEFITLDLRGSRGRSGSTGSSGSSGRCGSRRDSRGRIVSNHRAGGRGGRGGTGGRGGRGGDLTIIFKDISNLKNILVDANGGPGGTGGRGGRGGSGCPSGSRGSSGSRGARGSDGQLFLVPHDLYPLEADTSQGKFSLSELIHGVKLTQRKWTEASGATQLLAQGSKVLDVYKIFSGYEYGSAKIEIDDRSMVDEKFLNTSFSVGFQNKNTTMTPAQNLVMKSTQTITGADTVVVIERLYEKSELNSLTYQATEGTLGKRKIILKTSARLIPWPKLSLHLTVDVKGRRGYFTLYSGNVEQKYITSTEQGYEVELDNLPLSQKILEGVPVKLYLQHQLIEGDIKSETKSEFGMVN